MVPCLEALLSKIRPKMRALLRLRHLYPTSTMMNQYKCHIWGLKEYSTGALILAPPSQLVRLDKIQRWYLHELGVSDTEAFVTYNFAPPSLRRSIGIFGFLHKRVLGDCHPGVRAALPFWVATGANFHDKALHPFTENVQYCKRTLFDRSLYAYILMYNRLPQELVDIPTVKDFQKKLTHLAKQRAMRDQEDWRSSFQHLSDIVRMFYGP
jgi:hypothetical protein